MRKTQGRMRLEPEERIALLGLCALVVAAAVLAWLALQ